MKKTVLACMLIVLIQVSAITQPLEQSFRHPPDTAKPWVFWFWINGNISREGITNDLEAMKAVGIGGMIWMEVSGPWWAPQGPIEAGSPEWHDAMQWAISEADRLGLTVDLSVDFGYGSGGPHITPDISMQKLVWREAAVQGGQPVTMQLDKPAIDTQKIHAWLRPGASMNPVVTKALQEIDSYRDVAVFAMPSAGMEASQLFKGNQKAYAKQHLNSEPGIPDIDKEPLRAYDGRGWKTHLPALADRPDVTPLAAGEVIDLSDHMNAAGELTWDAPPGDWTVIRLGHATNLKMTRPCPDSVVGLECDRLHPQGIEAHFEHRLKPILEAAGDKAGRTLQYIHIDSWEAYGQNWTAGFAEEFKERRGYDIRPWLPVLMGHTVQSVDATERFLRDMRQTVSEVTLAKYIDRLRELIAPYGVRFSSEPYGRLCVNSLEYASRSDFLIGEFWTERKIQKPFPTFQGYWYTSMKGLASVANTYGKQRVGAEAFTGSRGWVDHPYLIKGMGDEAFCNGVNHYVIHLSAHQAYDNMKPGLTHRRWGQHFNRHQTWWDFSKPWFDYVARCQFSLQQGRRVVDVACLYHEGAPLNFNNIRFALPPGYDYDLCTPEIIQQMQVREGRLELPNGVSYRYLVLPQSGRLSLPVAQQVEVLRKAGASIYQQAVVVGTPGLEGYPEADAQVKALAAAWPVLLSGDWEDVFAADEVKPDFEGDDLMWIHRHVDDTDLYFVANTQPQSMERLCTFRAAGKSVELWDPETGDRYVLPLSCQEDGRTVVRLEFEPAQSWFVVFRDHPSEGRLTDAPFARWSMVQEITEKWTLEFDPAWGPKKPQTFNTLYSWTEHRDPLVKYYSGTVAYRTDFDLDETGLSTDGAGLCLDLGQVEVMAQVILNGKDCGIAWKPPYRVDISQAVQPGRNQLEIKVVNTWVNRMIGDEQLPLDADWKNWETLLGWPDWFKNGRPSPTGRYTFTTGRHYNKDSALMPAGLLGPVRILSKQ